MSQYKNAITGAMNFLALDKKVVFLGQAVAEQGTAMRGTLEAVPVSKIVELPVDEDFQMGMAIGMALNGLIPVSIFPRWNFLLLATNQIVNHLDKIAELSRMNPPPKVIIRTAIGSSHPLNPGPQHTGDFTEAFKVLCPNINVVRLDRLNMIALEYKKALLREDGVSTILIERGDSYHE